MFTAKKSGLVVLLVSIILFHFSGTLMADSEGRRKEILTFEGSHQGIWHLKASKPYLIGGYGDNFNYSGSNVTPMLGDAEVLLDATKDAGIVAVTLVGSMTPEKGKTYTGKFSIYFRVKKGGVPFQEGGVADFVYMHGDTMQGPPVMPRERTYLGAWGVADVYLNGKLLYQNLSSHIMYTERTRDRATKAIYNQSKTDFYNPKNPSDGSVAAPEETEFHFVAHSEEKDKGNFPPNTVWMHLNFEEVRDISSVK
jgi:hypothetical protein